jgi:EAL domain-containing protein (putative c-di-GMP-specific phosphodiesterase class I)
VLAPQRFLRIAEDAGLMGPIARWIILRVCKLAMEWRKRMPADQEFFLSINLSPSTLRDATLGEYVATVLREIGLPPRMLKFEITEAALISNVAVARETLTTLHNLGVQLMLDDFGTGYSSLSYLQLFPFDFVKIDRPFVNQIGSDLANTGMTAAMVQIARGLKLIPIAEIIETSAAAAAVHAMGCDYAQGYYFSEPLDAGSIFHRLMSGLAFEPAAVGAETMEIAPLPEDTSATVLLPAGELFDSSEPDSR